MLREFEFDNKITKFNDTYYMGSVGIFDATLLYPLDSGEMLEVARTYGSDSVIVYESGHDEAVQEFADYFEIEELELTYLWD